MLSVNNCCFLSLLLLFLATPLYSLSSCRRGFPFLRTTQQQNSVLTFHYFQSFRYRIHNQLECSAKSSPSSTIKPEQICCYEEIQHQQPQQQQQRQQSLIDLVKLSCDGYPFIDPNRCEQHNIPIAIDPAVLVDTDILCRTGLTFYQDVSSQWRDQAPRELFNSSCVLVRISQLSRDSVVIQWNASFIPDSIQSLVAMANTIPGWRVNYFNILDKETVRSSFSWQALGKFCFHLFFTGEMRLPAAVILGTMEMKFKESESNSNDTNLNIPSSIWTLVEAKERISLVNAVRSGRLKNRRLAMDLLEFLDARKPASLGVNDWNDLVLDKVPIVQSVPGMRQFDIDGLEGEDQQKILTVSNSILGYLTAVVLLLGLCSGTVVLDHVLMYRQQVSDFDARINQELY